MVHGDALQGGHGGAGLGDGEGGAEEGVPAVLERGHEEAVGHEAGEALEVEGWGEGGGGGEGGGFFFQVGEFDGYGVGGGSVVGGVSREVGRGNG